MARMTTLVGRRQAAVLALRAGLCEQARPMFFDRAGRVRPAVRDHLDRYLGQGKTPAQAVAAVRFRMTGIEVPVGGSQEVKPANDR